MAGFSLTFNTLTDSFTKLGGCTLAVYNGTNAATAQAFDGSNCNFYFDSTGGSIYNYQIIKNGSSKIIIITNPTTGNQIYYNNYYVYLGTKNNILKKNLKLYPNPAKDFLTIENIERNLKLKIFEISGKLVYETLSSDTSMRVDISHFQKGQYILIIENLKPFFYKRLISKNLNKKVPQKRHFIFYILKEEFHYVLTHIF